MPDRICSALAALRVETPTWGFGDSGTRFATFEQRGRPRDVFERIDDAAKVHALTGSASAVALHFPWDAAADLGRLRGHVEASGLAVGAINPNLFQDPDYRTGSVANADPRIRGKAVRQLIECVEIARALGSKALSLWLADGTNYPGQDDLRARRERLLVSLLEVYAILPADQELLIEYKPFEPAFYATDIADWGSALLVCRDLGERARVVVDLGHHLHGTNIEQIVSILIREHRLGGFHFNARKYADDDLIVGSSNPFELFLIFCELVQSGRPLPRLAIDQSHNVEPKVEAMVMSALNIQQAYAKALLVDQAALADAQAAGNVLQGHQILLDAFETDVRALCAEARTKMGAAADPLEELEMSGYVDAKAGERRSKRG
jgi:L-rhamnose isomerase/sugar isomerase